MTGTRDGAIARAQAEYDDGTFLDRLASLVAVQTESHPPERKSELERYCHEVLGPMVAVMGFRTEVLDNPEPIHGPVLVATRIEDPALPTVLFYGHGDVVRAMPERWRPGLDPWKLTVEGDRVYGRGTVDNKGQHLLGIDAMGAVMEERGGRLGFNVKIMVETGEEAGSPGLLPFIRAHRDLLAADVFIALDGPRGFETQPDDDGVTPQLGGGEGQPADTQRTHPHQHRPDEPLQDGDVRPVRTRRRRDLGEWDLGGHQWIQSSAIRNRRRPPVLPQPVGLRGRGSGGSLGVG